MFIKTKVPPDYNDPDDTGIFTGTVFRYFDISEVENEEEYLMQMHRDGWKLTKTGNFGLYRFESCPPEEVVYRIEYNADAAKHRDSYLKMYEDYGWECAASSDTSFYFRRSAENAASGELEIFSDDESRLEMMRTVIRKELLYTLYITLCSTLIFLVMFFQLSFDRVFHIIGITLYGILLLIFYALLLRRILGFCRFHKKYSRKKAE